MEDPSFIASTPAGTEKKMDKIGGLGEISVIQIQEEKVKSSTSKELKFGEIAVPTQQELRFVILVM